MSLLLAFLGAPPAGAIIWIPNEVAAAWIGRVMRKNVAGQHISFGLIKASDGTALAGASPAGYLSKDGAAQGALAGSFTGLGNGQYDYAPTQAETNCNEMGLLFTAATAFPVAMTIYTTAADPSDTVRLGLTALPNAAANAAGGLPISAAGGLALDTKLANTDQITVARMGALTDWIDAGRLDVLLDAIKAQTDLVTAARMGALTDLIDGGRLDLLIDAIKAKTDLGLLNTMWTDAKAGYLTGAVALDGTVAKDATVAKEATLATVGGYIDTEITDLGNRLPAALVGGKMDAVVDKTGYSLSTAGISAIWAEVLEGTLSAAAFLRIILSVLAGITTDDGKEFYGLNGTTKRVDGIMVGKNRTVSVLDGS